MVGRQGGPPAPVHPADGPAHGEGGQHRIGGPEFPGRGLWSGFGRGGGGRASEGLICRVRFRLDLSSGDPGFKLVAPTFEPMPYAAATGRPIISQQPGYLLTEVGFLFLQIFCILLICYLSANKMGCQIEKVFFIGFDL